jgi:hypothetical protein
LLPLYRLGLNDFSETIGGPEFEKLRNRRRAVALIVIVRVRVNQNASIHSLVAKIHPSAEFGGAINDDLVPRHRLCFDLFPVAQPTDVGPIRRDRVEIQFRWIRHPRPILQHECDAVAPEQIRELGVQPRPISDFNRELAIGELLQEGDEPVRELMPISKYVSSKERKLENNRPELRAKNIHHFHELRKLGIAVHQNLVVRDRLRNLHGEDEALRRSSRPVLDGFSGWASVEGRVYLDGMEPLRVKGEVVGRLHASRIKRAIPSSGGKGRGSEQERRMIHAEDYTEPDDSLDSASYTMTFNNCPR